MNKVVDDLFKYQDKKYKDFQSKLIPNISSDSIIGVRIPDIRKYSKILINEDYKSFLNDLPHKYYDENLLHSSIISLIKDYDECIFYINNFLPYIDNWAVCDTLIIKKNLVKKNSSEFLKEINKWIKSKHTYTIRYGIASLMRYYLDEDFSEEYLEMVSKVKSNEYYVNMMISWYFATALAKQWDKTIKYIEERRLDKWTHNKTIQKAIESYRITKKQKEYLRGLKVV